MIKRHTVVGPLNAGPVCIWLLRAAGNSVRPASTRPAGRHAIASLDLALAAGLIRTRLERAVHPPPTPATGGRRPFWICISHRLVVRSSATQPVLLLKGTRLRKGSAVFTLQQDAILPPRGQTAVVVKPVEPAASQAATSLLDALLGSPLADLPGRWPACRGILWGTGGQPIAGIWLHRPHLLAEHWMHLLVNIADDVHAHQRARSRLLAELADTSARQASLRSQLERPVHVQQIQQRLDQLARARCFERMPLRSLPQQAGWVRRRATTPTTGRTDLLLLGSTCRVVMQRYWFA